VAVTSAVFVDKDGTLVDDVPYNVDPARIRLRSGAEHALGRLRRLGLPIVVVSNQSGLAHGYFSETELARADGRLRELVAETGVALLGTHYCPHHPRGAVARWAIECGCRKPAAGLLEAAAREHGISLASSWMIGDILDDVEAGRRAGVTTILLEGGETEWRSGPNRAPHHRAATWRDAVDVIARRPRPEVDSDAA
jgi:D-glycero-D-manno-heptose 1,7-bisphosphate phosphatase